MKSNSPLTRRQFLATAGAVAAAGRTWSSTGQSQPPAGRVAEAFVPLRLGEIMPEGWLRAQLERDVVSGFTGHLDSLLQDPDSKKFLLKPENNDFVTRADNKDCRVDAEGYVIPPGVRSWWDGELIGDWHDALIRTAFLTGDPAARAKADRFVNDILKSQDEDGYIGIYRPGYRFHFRGVDGELWTQRCVLLGLLAYYEFTGRQDVLRAVERAVKLTIRQYGPGKSYFGNPGQGQSSVSHGLMFLDVLEWLDRLTGDEEYRRAALFFYGDFNASSAVQDGDVKLAHLLDMQIPLAGHGPDVMGDLRAPLLCYYLTGDPKYREAYENFVAKIQRHLGAGGSPLSGQDEEVKAQGQSPDMPYEYCSTFYLLHSLVWAMQKTGEARYGDMFERAMFNAAQGARFADGKALTYYSADERLWVRVHPPEGRPNMRFIYTAAFFPACCHNSGARVSPYAVSALWMRSRGPDGDGLAATLYGPNRVSTRISGVPVTVTERTGYPFSFDVEFSLQAAQPVAFPLRFRVPAWSGEPAVVAAGAQIDRDKRGFLVVSKTWKNGDTVRVTLKPAIHGEKAVNGTTALAYGPLVFSLPIPEKAEIVERFPEAEAEGLHGFFGYQYDPADLASAKRPLELQAGKPGLGFRVVPRSEADPLRPWDRSPLALEGELIGANNRPESATLEPMGCTLLRRTFFSTAA